MRLTSLSGDFLFINTILGIFSATGDGGVRTDIYIADLLNVHMCHLLDGIRFA